MPEGSQASRVDLRGDGFHRFLVSGSHEMRFYRRQHGFYCGVDLHARTMHVCVVDAEGQTREHVNLPCDAGRFLQLIGPYRDQLVVSFGDGSIGGNGGEPFAFGVRRPEPSLFKSQSAKD